VLLHPERAASANRPQLAEARLERELADRAAAVPAHRGHHATVDLLQLLELEPHALESAEPILYVGPDLLVAASDAPDRAVLERRPLELGIHPGEHGV
jgi:hypothetical protein